MTYSGNQRKRGIVKPFLSSSTRRRNRVRNNKVKSCDLIVVKPIHPSAMPKKARKEKTYLPAPFRIATV
jgi:hypothetical protein